MRPTGRPGRHGWTAFVRGSRPPGSMPTSASGPSTPATSRGWSSARARRRSPASPVSSSSGARRWRSSPTRATRSRRATRRPTRGSSRRTTTCRAAGPRSSPRSGRGASRSKPASCPRPRGRAWPRRPPDVELVPVEGWVEADRAVKEPAELERVAAACAVADRALAALLPEIRPGVTEADLALRLEWLMRTGGAEALAFDVACLAGPQAALPHGSPGERPVLDGAVLLFDFGAQVDGYRSDMTRTLFVGEPAPRDLEVYQLVAGAQAAAIDALEAAVGRRGCAGRPLDRRRRPRDHRGGRSRRPLRPRPGSRHRARDARGAESQPDRRRDAAARARRSSRSSPGSISTARPACASRTSSASTPTPGRSSG